MTAREILAKKKLAGVMGVALALAAAPAFAASSGKRPAVPPLPAGAATLGTAMPMDQAGHVGHDGHGGDIDPTDHSGHEMKEGGADHAMAGVLGAYPMGRDASGTAWQPDASPHAGIHTALGRWTVMSHALLNGVYDRQNGPRGGEKSFLAGMAMVMARRPAGEAGTVQLRAMLSPDPFMGKSGYPLLLASGETANGADPLIDRQHPHDLFMELSASYAHAVSPRGSVFVYAGLPGEPAFGPPAFMHRLSIMDSPEAPISHHWLDSTHITFGVVTAGFVRGPFKIEASRFHGREPDERRFDIETGQLDSTAVRLGWNPGPHWSLQASWADVRSPEQLEPEVDQTKWSASAIRTVPLGEDGYWSTTLAWGRRSAQEGDDLNALALESAVKMVGPWTFFGRAEVTQANELGGHHGPAQTVAKVSVGAVRDFRIADRAVVGAGALYAFNSVGDELDRDYGGDPEGGMLFVRLKID